MLNLAEEGMSPRRLDQIIKSRSIRGILIPPGPEPSFDAKLDWSQIAVVAATTTARPLSLHRALPHGYHNNQLLINAAIEAGYRRIGLIIWEELELRQQRAASSTYAREGYIRNRFQPLPVFNWSWECQEKVTRAFSAWFKRSRPDCIISFGGSIVLEILKSMDIHAPRDIGYLSYSEAPDFIAQVDQLPRVVGSAAIDLLSAQVLRAESGLPISPKTMLIEGRFTPGSTFRRQDSAC
jgi:LacI family transcriptional regulator